MLVVLSTRQQTETFQIMEPTFPETGISTQALLYEAQVLEKLFRSKVSRNGFGLNAMY